MLPDRYRAPGPAPPGPERPSLYSRSSSSPRSGRAGGVDGVGAPVGRRVLLGTLGLGAAGVAAGPSPQRGLEDVLGSLPPQGPTGVTGLLPNGGGTRSYSVPASVPHRGRRDSRPTVDGLVDRPRHYAWDELHALPRHRLVCDVQCATGGRVPHTPFEGVRLSRLLGAAGVRPGAQAVRVTSFDGTCSESLTPPQARRTDVLVALCMRDRPIAHAHGGPVRLYVAPKSFYTSAKWLSRVTVTRDVRPTYWEKLGYGIDAWGGRSNGRDDAPTVRRAAPRPHA